jgi:hypothetical protein
MSVVTFHEATASVAYRKDAVDVRVLSERLYTTTQGAGIEVIGTIAFHDSARLRATVYRDSYDFQSSAQIERWDGARWQAVARIPMTLLTCLHFGVNYLSHTERRGGIFTAEGAEALRVDVRELFRLAAIVL